MRNRRLKSVKDELIKKAREAILAAVQIYNNPQITFKTETFVTLSIIGWTYLLHAYYREKGIDYRYYEQKGDRKKYHKTKYGAFKHWELEKCINSVNCPLDQDTINNLKFLIGIRHEIEHQMTNKIDEYLSAKLQACSINFDYYITTLFGKKYSLSKELSLAIQFSPITPIQQNELRDNPYIITNIRNFIVEFENTLPDNTLKSTRYAYRILLMPISAKRENQADQVVEYIKSDSPLAEGLEKTYTLFKETEKQKYLPSRVVAIMHELGYIRFTITDHTNLWKSLNAKNPIHGFGTQVEKTWYWYDNWVKTVQEHCEQNRNKYLGL